MDVAVELDVEEEVDDVAPVALATFHPLMSTAFISVAARTVEKVRYQEEVDAV